MALKSIQLAHMDRHEEDSFTVTVWSESQQQYAKFKCANERHAVKLRDALREHAECLVQVADYDR